MSSKIYPLRVQNGILDLATGRLLPSDYQMDTLDLNYAAHGRNSREPWAKEITDNDAQLAQGLAKWIPNDDDRERFELVVGRGMVGEATGHALLLTSASSDKNSQGVCSQFQLILTCALGQQFELLRGEPGKIFRVPKRTNNHLRPLILQTQHFILTRGAPPVRVLNRIASGHVFSAKVWRVGGMFMDRKLHGGQPEIITGRVNALPVVYGSESHYKGYEGELTVVKFDKRFDDLLHHPLRNWDKQGQPCLRWLVLCAQKHLARATKSKSPDTELNTTI